MPLFFLEDDGKIVFGYGNEKPSDPRAAGVGVPFFEGSTLKFWTWKSEAWVEIPANPNLNDYYWDDLRFPASGINPAGPATPPAVDGDDGCFLFHPSGTDTLGIIAQMPHGWKEGSTIHPHIHWAPTDAVVGNVLWRLEWQIADVNGTFPGVWSSDDLLAATSGVAEKHVVSEFTAITMTGRKLSCLLKIRVNRIGSDGTDTYTASAKVYEFDIHYQIDAAGSRAEYNK